MNPTELEAQALSLAYDTFTVIEKLDLSLLQGKITALVGPNGCGKSTLLRGLARLLKPAGGIALLEGQDIHRMNSKALARRLGILPQSPVAPEGLTVRDLVSQGRYPHQRWYQQWSAKDEEALQEALAITGMTKLEDRKVDTLSGGQRQRVWIAMVLAQNTQMLLLDEPTTFLDVAHQVDVLELLHHLNRVSKRTVVLVMHDLNQAARHADHLVFMRDGAIVANGAPEEIFTCDLVQEVFDVECAVISDPVTGSPMFIPLRRTADSISANSGTLSDLRY